MSGLGTGGGGLREKIEGSTIVDLLTVTVLAMDFWLLRQYGLADSYSLNSIMTISTDPLIIAAQLTGILLVIYVLEAVIDSSSH